MPPERLPGSQLKALKEMERGTARFSGRPLRSARALVMRGLAVPVWRWPDHYNATPAGHSALQAHGSNE